MVYDPTTGMLTYEPPDPVPATGFEYSEGQRRRPSERTPEEIRELLRQANRRPAPRPSEAESGAPDFSGGTFTDVDAFAPVNPELVDESLKRIVAPDYELGRSIIERRHGANYERNEAGETVRKTKPVSTGGGPPVSTGGGPDTSFLVDIANEFGDAANFALAQFQAAAELALTGLYSPGVSQPAPYANVTGSGGGVTGSGGETDGLWQIFVAAILQFFGFALPEGIT